MLKIERATYVLEAPLVTTQRELFEYVHTDKIEFSLDFSLCSRFMPFRHSAHVDARQKGTLITDCYSGEKCYNHIYGP